jgi:hypothetical protein
VSIFGLGALPAGLATTMRMIGAGMVVVDWLFISGMIDRADKIAFYCSYFIPERCVSILFKVRCGQWRTAERKANGFSSSVEITSC